MGRSFIENMEDNAGLQLGWITNTHCGDQTINLKNTRQVFIHETSYVCFMCANFQDQISIVHSRSAQRILDICLANGGLYIKFGQGLVSMNHVLPKEYLETLKVLQDKALKRTLQDEVDTIILQDFGKPKEGQSTFYA